MKDEDILKGALCMTLGFLFVALYAAFFKAASTSASTPWIIFISYLFAGLIQFFFICNKGVKFFKTRRIGSYAGRIFFGLFSSFLFMMAIKRVSLLNATLLFNTTPLFVPILAIFLLKTRVPLALWLSLILGFIGVVFIIKPQEFLLHDPGNLIGLSAGVIQALAFIFVKKLTTTEPVRRINFYFFSLSALMLAPYILLTWETPPPLIWIWTLCAGLMTFLGQLFIVKGYQYADASHVGPFQFASVLFSGIIGWLIWNQTPTLNDLIGALFVISGGTLAIVLFPKSKNTLRKILSLDKDRNY
jgi:drug/metabolite transporter (DMT)-like permease